MPIIWSKVTWYSRLIALILLFVTFAIGYALGGISQQGKDAAAQEARLLQAIAAQAQRAPALRPTINPTADATSTTPTTKPRVRYFGGKQICTSQRDCPPNNGCIRTGPLVAGRQTPKVCVPNTEFVPF